jgi:hypothetical protein
LVTVGVLPVNANFLHEPLPHSRLDFVDANHFAYEDRAEEHAALILDWWNGGYERVDPLPASTRKEPSAPVAGCYINSLA